MIIRTLCSLLILVLSGCGGGGGGSDDGGSRSASTGVRVLHGALDVGPADLMSSLLQTKVSEATSFAEPALYKKLDTGSQNLTLTLHNSPGSVFGSLPLSIDNNEHYSFLFYGNEGNLGLAVNLLKDDAGEIPEGNAAVRIVHALIGAAAVRASYSSGAGSEPVSFGTGGAYDFLPAGSGGVVIRRQSDSRVLTSISGEFAAGKAYTVFVTGEVDYFVTARLLED